MQNLAISLNEDSSGFNVEKSTFLPILFGTAALEVLIFSSYFQVGEMVGCRFSHSLREGNLVILAKD